MATTTPAPAVDVRRARERFVTNWGWLDSKHSFSFGPHQDPTNTHHGLLLVSNDDVVRAGDGFDTHPHRDMEIVTWVLDGSLVHQDSTGHSGIIYPGLAQRMSAGRGILHSERNDSWTLEGSGDGARHDRPVHFVQMWVVPDETGIDPSYQQHEIDAAALDDRFATVASGMPKYADDTAIHIRNRFAALHATRLSPGATVAVPDAPFVHVFVARGMVELEGAGVLHEGDAVRLTAAGGRDVTAIESSELLVWEMHAGIGA